MKNFICTNENKVNLPLFGMEMYEQLKQSKIIFNIHTNQSNYNCGNLHCLKLQVLAVVY